MNIIEGKLHLQGVFFLTQTTSPFRTGHFNVVQDILNSFTSTWEPVILTPLETLSFITLITHTFVQHFIVHQFILAQEVPMFIKSWC